MRSTLRRSDAARSSESSCNRLVCRSAATSIVMITLSEGKKLEESYLQPIRAGVALTKCAAGLIIVTVIALMGSVVSENKSNAATVSVPQAGSGR